MTRKFGNEKFARLRTLYLNIYTNTDCHRIRATFTVSDLQNVAEDEFDGLSESDYENINQGQSGEHISTRPEDSIASSDRDFDGEIPGFPVRVNITIEKPGNGALLIQTTASDGMFEIHEVSHFDKADFAEAETAEKDWHRQSLYSGPAYGNLDEDLQTLFDRYLEERGFNAELANIIPDYITVKEQKEYTRWLESEFLCPYSRIFQILTSFPLQLSRSSSLFKVFDTSPLRITHDLHSSLIVLF